MTAMIEMKNVQKLFGPHHVLKDINLSAERGKVLVIIGPSGSGKSTLLRCMNLLEMPTEGSLTVGDIRMEFHDGNKPKRDQVLTLRRQTGMVFQSYNLFPHMTVLANVMEAQVIVLKRSIEEARKRATELLRKVGLADKANAYPSQLSGGQQQRVGIARAMAVDPKVLLFDEPTSALDPELVGEVLKVIQELAAEGMTMVIVTHEMKFASQVADKVIMVDEGCIIAEGTPEEIIQNPAHERVRSFLSRITER
ncbi:amino acid ABC transporter ATP-binding protein [Paenibacillus sediminis]|uniref:Cystine transport system ATP-binding protein n=2 Tax=Paenibacillus sediminis TaxID=664909 RepID=A0ABS4H310_9BACL|nr:cystine transport system ATP-binding protein [Paenibacillus sediminis]